MKTSQTDTDLKRLEASSLQPSSASSESFYSFRRKTSRKNRFLKSESFTKINEDSKIKKKRKKDFLSRSCISQ